VDQFKKGESEISKSKYKVLFVDDSEDILATIERMFFKEEPLKIITAANPEYALKLVSSMDFNMIVTDIKMPDMHGLELIEKIRKKDPDIPIIIFTAYKGMKEDYIVRLYNIEAYFIKPIDWNRLYKKVKQMANSVNKPGKRKKGKSQ
jgi:DNA-binding NtrC family response regulator